ncbi:MAG: hypothetical protein ACFB51_01225, partial [Anaerolineae bacterium]
MINHAVLRIKSVAVLVVVALLAVTVTTTALAEGSRNLTDAGGDRAFTEWASGTTGGIDRQTVVKVFVNSGEEIRFGSSVAASINDPADILWRAPDGTTGTCNVQASGSGLIDTLAKEDAGPLPNTGGYDPCILLPGQTGIYEFEFYAPATSGNPPLTGVNDPFPTDGTQGSTVAAWDVTVLATPGDAGTEVTGRVFANNLSLNMGANGAALNPTLYVLTEDGYLYIVDLNSIDPFGFIFFSNNTGFKDADTGESVYRSVLTSEIGSTITLHNPADPDTSSDITMKIFFNPPASDLPETALAPNPDGGAPITTWLLRQTPIEPELPTQFTFVGAENDTPGQAAAGVGGRFVVDVPAGIVGSVTVSLDITGDGDVMDPEDVVLFRAIDSTGGAYTEEIPWTGADGTGSFDYIDTLPNRTLDAAAVQVVTNVGEVHFPFLDVESGANGFIIERAVSPLNPTPVSSLVFYDDSASALNPQPGEIAPTPRSALTGIDSAPGGAHGLDYNWGNEKGVDTWTFVESTTSLTLDTDITFGTADLAITKIDQTDPVVPGETFRYTITVTNNGPLPVVDAIVADDLPGY